jgi:competence protein ComEC
MTNFSVSKIIVWSLLSFILGISTSSFLSFSIFIILPFILLILIAWRLKSPGNFFNKPWLVLFVLMGFVFGYFYHQQSFDTIDENHIGFYQQQSIKFQGKIIEYPQEELDKLKIVVGEITYQGKSLKGKVLINTLLYKDYQYGDILEVEGKLIAPGKFGKFDYEAYLARQDIYAVCYWPQITFLEKDTSFSFYQSIFFVRNKIKNAINNYFPEPQGSFLSAILLGIRGGVSSQTRFWFAQSGLAHVLAISGLHITILAQILLIFFINVLLIRREQAFWPTVLIVVLFVLLVGAPASAVRAAIMGLGLVWANKMGRPQSSQRILLYTAVIMLLFNPQLLKSDIGWQLSFLAVLGISLLNPFFNQWLKNIPFKRYLSITLSAQIFTLPLILYYFGNFSLAGLIINVLVLPLIPLIMILGLGFALFSLVFLMGAKILFLPLMILTTAVILLAKIGAMIPFLSFLIVNFSLPALFISYLFILGGVLKIKRKQDFPDSFII